MLLHSICSLLHQICEFTLFSTGSPECGSAYLNATCSCYTEFPTALEDLLSFSRPEQSCNYCPQPGISLPVLLFLAMLIHSPPDYWLHRILPGIPLLNPTDELNALHWDFLAPRSKCVPDLITDYCYCMFACLYPNCIAKVVSQCTFCLILCSILRNSMVQGPECYMKEYMY